MRELFFIIIFYYNPISFVNKRNRVAPERKVLNPYPLAPASDSPLLKRGNKLTTARYCFLISTAIVQADGGFYFTFSARL